MSDPPVIDLKESTIYRLDYIQQRLIVLEQSIEETVGILMLAAKMLESCHQHLALASAELHGQRILPLDES